MRLEDHYDWVVLGSHPAALLNASLVAQTGLSVLVLPLGNTPSVYVSNLGQYLDFEPNYLIGMGSYSERKGLLSSCLASLGMNEADLQNFGYFPSFPQVLNSQVRLLFGSPEDLSEEFHREFGKTVSKKLGLFPALQEASPGFYEFWNRFSSRLMGQVDDRTKEREPQTLGELRKGLMSRFDKREGLALDWLSSKCRMSEIPELFAEKISNRTKSHQLQREWDHLWEEIGSGLWYLMTGTTYENPSPTLFEVLHLLSLSQTSGSFAGGMGAYRRTLLNTAKNLGVHIPLKTECKRLFIEREKFVGVQVTSRGNMISVKGGVLGCSLRQAWKQMVFTGKPWFKKQKTFVQPIGWRFTLALTVRAEAVPTQISTRSVWQENGAPSLEIEIVHPSDFHLEEPDCRLIFLRTVLPFDEESLNVENQLKMASRMMKQLSVVMPFIEFHVLRITPDFRTMRHLGALSGSSASQQSVKASSSQMEEWLSLYGFASLDSIPDHLLVYSSSDSSFEDTSTRIEGLYLASYESYPGLAGLGPLVSSLEAIAWIAKKTGVNWHLKASQ